MGSNLTQGNGFFSFSMGKRDTQVSCINLLAVHSMREGQMICARLYYMCVLTDVVWCVAWSAQTLAFDLLSKTKIC